jgi:hypothetical protein
MTLRTGQSWTRAIISISTTMSNGGSANRSLITAAA